MGYKRTFIPSEDKMKAYADIVKRYNPQFGWFEASKRELVHACMKPDTVINPVTVRNLDFNIRMMLDRLHDMVLEKAKVDAYVRWQRDGSIEYIGWEHRAEHQYDVETSINNHLDRLLVLANLVETPDYFENGARFYDKYNEVCEQVDGFIETMEEIAIQDIMDELSDCEVPEKNDFQDGALKMEGE